MRKQAAEAYLSKWNPTIQSSILNGPFLSHSCFEDGEGTCRNSPHQLPFPAPNLEQEWSLEPLSYRAPNLGDEEEWSAPGSHEVLVGNQGQTKFV